jgi:hypothetical protein
LSHRFIAERLDRFAQRVLEVFADAEGVLVGVFIEAVEQAGALIRGEAVVVQQPQPPAGCSFLAVEDFGPVEAQQTIVRPLVAVEQQPFPEADQNDVARRLVAAEQRFAKDFQPGELLNAGGISCPP